jgi:hypothetical protein
MAEKEVLLKRIPKKVGKKFLNIQINLGFIIVL